MKKNPQISKYKPRPMTSKLSPQRIKIINIIRRAKIKQANQQLTKQLQENKPSKKSKKLQKINQKQQNEQQYQTTKKPKKKSKMTIQSSNGKSKSQKIQNQNSIFNAHMSPGLKRRSQEIYKNQNTKNKKGQKKVKFDMNKNQVIVGQTMYQFMGNNGNNLVAAFDDPDDQEYELGQEKRRSKRITHNNKLNKPRNYQKYEQNQNQQKKEKHKNKKNNKQNTKKTQSKKEIQKQRRQEQQDQNELSQLQTSFIDQNDSNEQQYVDQIQIDIDGNPRYCSDSQVTSQENEQIPNKVNRKKGSGKFKQLQNSSKQDKGNILIRKNINNKQDKTQQMNQIQFSNIRKTRSKDNIQNNYLNTGYNNNLFQDNQYQYQIDQNYPLQNNPHNNQQQQIQIDRIPQQYVNQESLRNSKQSKNNRLINSSKKQKQNFSNAYHQQKQQRINNEQAATSPSQFRHIKQVTFNNNQSNNTNSNSQKVRKDSLQISIRRMTRSSYKKILSNSNQSLNSFRIHQTSFGSVENNKDQQNSFINQTPRNYFPVQSIKKRKQILTKKLSQQILNQSASLSSPKNYQLNRQNQETHRLSTTKKSPLNKNEYSQEKRITQQIRKNKNQETYQNKIAGYRLRSRTSRNLNNQNNNISNNNMFDNKNNFQGQKPSESKQKKSKENRNHQRQQKDVQI